MKTLKVYFDFQCPYCYKSITDLIDLLPDYPELTIKWEPCESHPRPEICSHYSDLVSEAFLFVEGHQGQMIPFIQSVFQAHFIEGKEIDDKELLVSFSDICNVEAARLKASLTRRDYKQDIMSNNNEIWNIYGADAVPAYYCRNRSLVSKENYEITKEELIEFLNSL